MDEELLVMIGELYVDRRRLLETVNRDQVEIQRLRGILDKVVEGDETPEILHEGRNEDDTV